jgi:hypothetical protein
MKGNLLRFCYLVGTNYNKIYKMRMSLMGHTTLPMMVNLILIYHNGFSFKLK